MKTIFHDPIQWAGGFAGTNRKYRFMQAMTIILGCIIFSFIFVLNKYNQPPDQIGFLLLLFILVVRFIKSFTIKNIYGIVTSKTMEGLCQVKAEGQN